MGIYSETTSNTPLDSTSFQGENCYTCTNDCQGIILDVLRETWDNLSFDELQEYSFRVFDIFNSKNYTNVHYTPMTFMCRVPHLKMYVSQAKTLAKHLKPLGYECEIIPYTDNHYRGSVIIFKDGVRVHPLDLLDVFKTIPVRGEGK